MPHKRRLHWSRLPLIHRSGRLLLHGVERHPRVGNCGGHGFVRRELIDHYVAASETCSVFWTNDSDGFPMLQKPAPVYVCDLGALFSTAVPVTFRGPLGLSVGLPSRTPEYTDDAERLYAWAAAVHELTHYVCLESLGYLDVPRRWEWWSEAVAVWAESELIREPAEHLRFALAWTDQPHIPLTAQRNWYASYPLVRYLAARFGGKKFIADVWKRAGGPPSTRPSAWEAINISVPEAERGTWFSDYCVDAYFCGSQRSKIHSPLVYKHFGARRLEHTYTVSLGAREPILASINPLSCRYFRILADSPVSTIAFSAPFNGLSLDVAASDSDLGYSQRWRLPPVADSIPVRMSEAPARELILVASNNTNEEIDLHVEVRGG